MSKKDLRTNIIYILMVIIVILLIVIKKIDDKNKPDVDTSEVPVEKVEEDDSDDQSPEISTPVYKGTIGLIIDDFGYRNDNISDGFLNLNAKLTYAVIPGHEHSKSFSEKAVDKNFEVIIHMPLENIFSTKGEEEFVLMTSMVSDTIQKRVHKAFNQIPVAIGMNNHQGSKGSADEHIMENIGKVIKDKSLFFVDSRTTVNTIAESTMEKMGIPTARRNVFLDNEADVSKITAQMILLSQVAEKKGFAIGIGHVKPITLEVLQKQIPVLEKKGFKFDFVSNLLH